MKTILFRFEKEKIHFLECTISSGNLIIGDKEKISLESTTSKGEKYKKILDELLHIQTKYSPHFFMYQLPQKYRGAIKDEEGFANSAILNLYCYQNSFKIFELTPATVREKLSIPSKDFKKLLEEKRNEVLRIYKITKSDKLIDGLVFLFSLKETF